MDRNAWAIMRELQTPVALRKESVDRNALNILAQCPFLAKSLSARRAWIEILLATLTALPGWLTSLSARRAWIEIRQVGFRCDLLLVALRKESVDRNAVTAYIKVMQAKVALRKESVDRNALRINIPGHGQVSLSARRAWIEISGMLANWYGNSVALRKESVDRNVDLWEHEVLAKCRSPQGERG